MFHNHTVPHFFRHESTVSPLVPRGRICLKSPHNSIQIPLIDWLLPVRSLRVRSRALVCHWSLIKYNGFGFLDDFKSAVPLLMLHTGMSIAFKSSGILKVLCKVRSPRPIKSVAAIPLDAVANAILPSDDFG